MAKLKKFVQYSITASVDAETPLEEFDTEDIAVVREILEEEALYEIREIGFIDVDVRIVEREVNE